MVTESRRVIGYDGRLRVEGAVVYTVDSSIQSGYGPIKVANDRTALTEGQSVTVEGVTVTVVSGSPEGDTVQVVVGG